MAHGPLPNRACAYHTQHHLSMNRHDHRIIPDHFAVNISARRLRIWDAELQSINEYRQAIKSLSMPKVEKSKLLACTTQIGRMLENVTGEIRQKLKV
jgi:hypothetical protein